MCMYVNKRVELAQRGIALYKMYVCIIIVTSLVHEGIKCRRAILSVATATENASRLGDKHVCVTELLARDIS